MSQGTRKILIVDDEPDILEIIGYNLQQAGYETATAKDGEEALIMAQSFHPDLIIMDIMMPNRNGIEACRQLRRIPEFRETLILFLTALGDETSEITGLNTGADDYIIKPITPRLLTSRVNALFRRLNKEPGKTIEVGDLVIDRDRFTVSYQGQEIILAKKEFELLELLASKPGRVFLRNEILDKIWGREVIVGDRTIDVHVRKLRQKTGVDLITTVKGVGYKFEI